MTLPDPIHIGTSGWHYGHWEGNFYPEGMDKGSYLSHYCTKFRTVEINNSFYQLPSTETFQDWRDTVPGDFIFSVKASRYITHMKKLKDPAESVQKFLDRLPALQDKLGPILFQLPPNWGSNPERLSSLIEVLPEDLRYAFEFRDRSWFISEIYDILSDADAAFCIYELDGRISPKRITSDLVYLRLHGPDGPYRGQYDDETLGGWADDFRNWCGEGREIYCYFDNDEAGYAAQDAQRLIEMLN